MPLVLSPKEQSQAASAGKDAYPSLGQVKNNSIIVDEFTRADLNPTNAVAYYTTAATGAGTATLVANERLELVTTGVIGDDVDVRLTNLTFQRTPRDFSFIDSRSQLIFNIVFAAVEATATEVFIGIINATAASTGLPATARHLGIQLDQSVSNNWFLTSADGTTQTTTNTGIAVSAGVRVRLRMVWNGDESATLELYTGTLLDTLASTQTVTALVGAANSFQLHFFIQTEALAAKTLRVTDWRVDVT